MSLCNPFPALTQSGCRGREGQSKIKAAKDEYTSVSEGVSGTGGSCPRCNRAIGPIAARLRRQVSGLAVWHPKMPWGMHFSTMQFSRDCATTEDAGILSLVILCRAIIQVLEVHIE